MYQLLLLLEMVSKIFFNTLIKNIVTEIGTHGGEKYSCTLLYLCVGS